MSYRVLHVTASGACGGGATHLLQLLPALRDRGLHVALAADSEGPLLNAMAALGGVTFALPMMHARADWQVLASLEAVVAAQRPHVVHFHGTRAAFYGALWRAAWCRTRHALPTVYTAHGLASRQRTSPLRGMLAWAAEAVCAQHTQIVSVSAADALVLRQLRPGATRRPVAHVGNAVDLGRFAPGARGPARARLGLRARGKIMGTTARLVPQKDVKTFLDAAQALPDVQALVLGDGPQRTMLAQHPAVISGSAKLLGERHDVAACLAALDVFVLTSLWEGEPIALLEAMACGLPVVATQTAGAGELLAGGRGILVPLGDAAALARSVAALCRDAALAAALGNTGRMWASQRTAAAQAQQLCCLYEPLL